MRFVRVTDLHSADGHNIPAYLFEPVNPKGAAVVIHGYGGAKEQMLGLSARIAEGGWASLAFDLRGHGEHPAPLNEKPLEDVEAVLRYMRRYGKVAVVGHSLGGRLALSSSADLIVAVSAAVASRPSEEGRQMLLAFGSTTVRSPSPGYILELLREMGEVKDPGRPVLLLYAERDIPTLIEGNAALAGRLSRGTLTPIATFQHVEAPLAPSILPYLHRWFNHLDLKFNPEVFQQAVGWLNAQGVSG